VGNSRYDRDRPVDGIEAAEARALHTVAELLSEQSTISVDRSMAGQIAEVLHAAAIELDRGRPVPLGLRRAVRGLANSLRTAMEPRGKSATPGPSGS
jgi:hypothetical protein